MSSATAEEEEIDDEEEERGGACNHYVESEEGTETLAERKDQHRNHPSRPGSQASQERSSSSPSHLRFQDPSLDQVRSHRSSARTPKAERTLLVSPG